MNRRSILRTLSVLPLLAIPLIGHSKKISYREKVELNTRYGAFVKARRIVEIRCRKINDSTLFVGRAIIHRNGRKVYESARTTATNISTLNKKYMKDTNAGKLITTVVENGWVVDYYEGYGKVL